MQFNDLKQIKSLVSLIFANEQADLTFDIVLEHKFFITRRLSTQNSHAISEFYQTQSLGSSFCKPQMNTSKIIQKEELKFSGSEEKQILPSTRKVIQSQHHSFRRLSDASEDSKKPSNKSCLSADKSEFFSDIGNNNEPGAASFANLAEINQNS